MSAAHLKRDKTALWPGPVRATLVAGLARVVK
jgi:hypothetical protein